MRGSKQGLSRATECSTESSAARTRLQESATVQVDLLTFRTVRRAFAVIAHSAGTLAGFRHSAAVFAGNGYSATEFVEIWHSAWRIPSLFAKSANLAALFAKPANALRTVRKASKSICTVRDSGKSLREVVRKPGRGMRRSPFRQKLHFAPPFTSKTALVFDFSGSKTTGPHGRASYLHKHGVPYRPYGKTCLGFQTRVPFSK